MSRILHISRRIGQFGAWWIAPLDESRHGLSLVRLMAVSCFVLVGHTVYHEHALTWVDFSVLMAGISAAFGKKVWVAWLARNQVTVQGMEQRLTAEITQRREQAAKDGWPGRESA